MPIHSEIKLSLFVLRKNIKKNQGGWKLFCKSEHKQHFSSAGPSGARRICLQSLYKEKSLLFLVYQYLSVLSAARKVIPGCSVPLTFSSCQLTVR